MTQTKLKQMKHILFLAIASMVMFACSNDDVAPLPKEEDSSAVVFELQAISKDNNTRRPFYSQDTTQAITRVNVYAFKNDGSGNYLYQKTFTISGWTTGTSSKTYTVPTVDKLPLGDYKFIATGQEASDAYVMPTLTAGTTNYNTVSISVAAAGNEFPNEFYSGTASYTISGAGGARIYIPIKRNVAGVLGYFQNVPATFNGTPVRYLRLSISNANTAVNLSTGTASNPTGTPLNVINIDLNGQTITNGVYTGIDLSGQGVIKLPNSQLSGSFVIPVTGITMTLGLYDVNGNALKTWQVMNEDSETSFDITANQLFALGQKVKTGSTDGGTPTPPGPTNDDDKAIDLLIDQEITVYISASWDVIHNMTIN